MDYIDSDGHAGFWARESAAARPTEWERWATELEARLGHDLDGDLAEDGYSYDTAYEIYQRGATTSEAADEIEQSKQSVRSN